MKPAWDKLMKAMNSDTILIADVDCTAEGKDLCEEHGVQGFPTIKYGDPSGLEDYEGGRGFDELSTFAKELKPLCSPSNMDLCDEEQKKTIGQYKDMDLEKLGELIEEKEQGIKTAESEFEAEVEKLQAQYEELSKSKDEKIRHEVFQLMGTYSRSMVTMFEISFGSWISLCRLLSDNVNEAYAIFFLVYRYSRFPFCILTM